MEKENKGCGCGPECGCEHDHNHDHGAECGCGPMKVSLEDDNGNVIECEIIDGFELDGKEYAVLMSEESEELYIFGVEGDEEVGELVVPTEEDFQKAREHYEKLVEMDEVME